MQPANAVEAERRPRPALLAATTDRKLSRGRLQLINISLGSGIERLRPMRATLIALACMGPAPALAQRMPPPIIDMHLHAGPATAQGPPPARICAPIQRMATRDPRQSAEEYGAMLHEQRGCPVPLVSASTDAQLLEQTLEVLKRRNIYAVTSGPWDWVQRWHAAALDRR
jgi:hypothetical protein